MASTLIDWWTRLFGGGAADPRADPVDYNGYRILPEPYLRRGQYQTAGTIDKEIEGELKQHRFVRAETHASREAAIAFTIAKAKQMIDEQGDWIFRAP